MKVFLGLIVVFGVWVQAKDDVPINHAQWNIPQNKSMQWNIPKYDSNFVNWSIPKYVYSSKKYTGRKPPQEVVNYAKQIAVQYGIEAAAILAACYHERGIKNWYDDFLCGFGATDDLNWNKSRWGGWQKQIRLFAKRANRCGYFKVGITITTTHAQNFARYCYKTTAWQNYGRIVSYLHEFRRL